MARSIAQQAEDNRRRAAAGEPEKPITIPGEAPVVQDNGTLTPSKPDPQPVAPPPPPPAPAPMAPPQIGGSAQAPAPLYADLPTMPTYEAPQGVAPVTVATSPGVTIGGANTVGNTPVANAAHGTATLAGPTVINGQDQNQIRGQQMDYLSALKAASEGRGPSAAMDVYKRASDDAVNDQLALSAMTHGTDASIAAMKAATNIGRIQANAGLGASQVAAEEQQKARETLGNQLVNTRDADQKMAIAQSQLDQATAALNAHLQTDVSLRNADFDNETARLRAQLDQATAFRNAAADEQMRMKQGEMDLSNNQFNTGETNKVGMFNAQQEQNRNNLDAQLKNTFGVSLAELEAKVNQFNASQGQQNTQFYAGLNNQRDLANLSAMLQTMGYNNDQIRAFMSGYMGSAGAVAGADNANRVNDDKFFWDMVNLGGSIASKGLISPGNTGPVTSRAAVGPAPGDETMPINF